MYQRMRLIQGAKASPTRTLDLAAATGGGIYLPWDAPAPTAAERKLVYTAMHHAYDGQRRISSTRENAKFALLATLDGNRSLSYMERLRAEIVSFLEQAGLYEEQGIGEPIYLEHCWHNSSLLAAKPQPVVGQWRRYWRIIDGGVPDWGRNAHSGGLAGGMALGVAIELECYSWAEGVEQQLFNANSNPADGATNAIMRRTMKTEFSDEFGISFWTSVLENQTYVWAYVADADGKPLNSYGNTGNSGDYRVYITKSTLTPGVHYNLTVYADMTTANYGTVLVAGLQNGDPVHFFITQNASTFTVYANGQLLFNISKLSMPPNGFVDFGAFGSGGVSHTSDLDAVRIWSEAWSAAEIQSLYADELAAKKAVQVIGRPGYFQTRDGDGKTYNSYGNTGGDYGYGVAGWIGGDIAAGTRLSIKSPETPKFYLGYFALDELDENFDPRSFYNNYNGATISASPGGGYTTISPSPENLEYFQGRFLVGVIFKPTVIVNSATLRANYILSGFWDVDSDGAVITTTSANPIFYDTGEVFFDWRVFSNSPSNQLSSPGVSYTGSSSCTGVLYATRWLPSPAMVMSDQDHGSGTAYTLDIDGDKTILKISNSFMLPWRHYGQPITVRPGKRNYVYVIAVELNNSVDLALSSSLNVFVTPRWTASGGPVAG